jgi:hypothetical protein
MTNNNVKPKEIVMRTKVIATALIASIGALVAASGSADAHQRWRYDYSKREARQSALISQGVHNGTLTNHEVFMLRREHVRIARLRKAFGMDGHLNWRERQAIRYAQDAATQHIMHERNDREGRRVW